MVSQFFGGVVLAGFGLLRLVLAGFGSFWLVPGFSKYEGFSYMLFLLFD